MIDNRFIVIWGRSQSENIKIGKNNNSIMKDITKKIDAVLEKKPNLASK